MSVDTYKWMIESMRGHNFVSTDSDSQDSCLTCGGEWYLIPSPERPDYGIYVTSGGEPADPCTYRTDLCHGIERHCEAIDGRACQANYDNGTCEHTEHDCNCVLCS